MAELLIAPTPPGIQPWQRLLGIVQRLAQLFSRGWLLVIDNVCNTGDEDSLDKFWDALPHDGGSVMITTTRLDVAKTFINHFGACIRVPPLDACYSADVLALGAAQPSAGVYDQLANMLEYVPGALGNASKFLSGSGMSAYAYDTRVAYLFDARSWGEDGLAAHASRLAFGLSKHSPGAVAHKEVAETAAVLRSCVEPSLYLLFERLEVQHPPADDLLSALSVLGRATIPCFLLVDPARRAATEILVNHSMLLVSSVAGVDTAYEMSKLLMMARRAWLVKRKSLTRSYAAVRELVALHDPPGDLAQIERAFDQMEPLHREG
ncbi:hypothetical protein LTR85_000892 [Meristemomyces frigidus]|nr:hypothetical protein LTR85_000892 [Meristemomyces frigidus]